MVFKKHVILGSHNGIEKIRRDHIQGNGGLFAKGNENLAVCGIDQTLWGFDNTA